jgi:hypothetical protein
MTSLHVFKGFAIVRTSSVQETAEWVLAMADKIHRDMTVKKKVPFVGSTPPASPTDTVESYSTVVKRVKKENVTPQNIGEIFLCQLPGISHVAATAICSAYPSLVKLVDALRKDPLCLQSLTTTDAGGKSRKLGKHVHKAIAEYLLFQADVAVAEPSLSTETKKKKTTKTKKPVKPEATTSEGLGWRGAPLDPPEDASKES